MWVKLNWKNLSQILSKTVSRIVSRKLSWIQSKTLGQIESGKTESNPAKNFELNQVKKTWAESCWKTWFESSRNRWIAWNCQCWWWGSRRRIRYGNGQALGIAAEHFLFTATVMTRGTVDLIVDVDVGCAISVKIPCNGAVKRVPRDVFYTGGLASEVIFGRLVS